MSIVRMKKLRVIALRDQRDALMLALQRFGCVEVHEPEELLSDEEAAALLRPEKACLAEHRTALASMQAAVRVLEHYAPEKKKLLSARPMVKESDFLNEEALTLDEALAETINGQESRVRRLASDIARLETEIESLRPWQAFTEPLNGAGTKTCGVAMLSAAAQIDMAAVRATAEAVSEEELRKLKDREASLQTEKSEANTAAETAKTALKETESRLRADIVGCLENRLIGSRDTGKETGDLIGEIKEAEAAVKERLADIEKQKAALEKDSELLKKAETDLETAQGPKAEALAKDREEFAKRKQEACAPRL